MFDISYDCLAIAFAIRKMECFFFMYSLQEMVLSPVGQR